MNTDTEVKIPYNNSNFERCKCSQCPVQADSTCAQNMLNNLKGEIELRKGMAPEPKQVPGVYCSTGESMCKDLNPNKQCMCKTCTVWEEYCLQNAKPMMYFCNIGKAD